MKVLWIASWYPTKITPFNGDFIQRMAQAVHPYCDLAVLSAVEAAETRKIEVKKGDFLEIVIYYPVKSNSQNFFRGWSLIKAYWIGYQCVIKEMGKPDFIHLQVTFPAGLFVLFLLWTQKIPLLITEHWSGFRRQKWDRLRYYHKWIAKKVISKASYVLPVSKALAADMKSLGFNGNYRIIPNVVRTDLFKPSENLLHKDNFTFIHISNLVDEVKNVSGILRAFYRLSKNEPKITLKIIGDGVDKTFFQRMIEEWDVSIPISFTGQLSYLAVSQHLQEADCLILFSNYENLPCVMLEALATGVPVISSETGRIGDWIDDTTGILIPVKDEKALLRAMKQMLAQSGRFDKVAMRQKIVDKCSYQAVGAELAHLYNSCTKKLP